MTEWITLRRQLHQIPEAGYKEFKTQEHLLSYLSTLPSESLQIQTWKTGILARIPGKKGKRCIGFRADMDGLPLQEQTTYSFQSQHKGYMHACGHDMHMAIAMGILTHFVHHPIDDDLLFIFQPAEEGPGGAFPMLQSTEFRKWKPDIICALHIAPEYPVGTLATRPDILFANTSELFIDLIGKSGHAAYPHLASDMVIASAHLVTELQNIVSRNIDPLQAAVLTVGEIHAGTRQNIIAEHGRLTGTIRTLSEDSMKKIKERVLEIVQGIQTIHSCQVTVDWGADYCEVRNHPELTTSFVNWLCHHTSYSYVECPPSMAGEDFGYFLKEIPGFMFWLGVDTPYSLHHPKIEPSEDAIRVAIDVMTRYISFLSREGTSVNL